MNPLVRLHNWNHQKAVVEMELFLIRSEGVLSFYYVIFCYEMAEIRFVVSGWNRH